MDDLTHLRGLYGRTTLHSYLAVEVIAAADAFMAALFGGADADITYKAKRAEYERVIMERPIE